MFIKRLPILLALLLLLSACSEPGVSDAVSPAPETPSMGHSPEPSPEIPPFLIPSPSPDIVLAHSPEELVAMMTLEEKIGQMTQAERQDLWPDDIRDYHIGSVLSGGGSAPASNTVEGWNRLTGDLMRKSKSTRLGIPLLYGIDAVHGHNNVVGATVYPHNVGLGAIAVGNPELGTQLAEAIGEATAGDMLATGIHWTFAPVLGVPYDIRWGRTYECFGEDVGLVTAMGPAVIRGLQQSGLVAACMKHYLGEGQTLRGQNQGNAVMDDDEIRAILPPYIEAIKDGALTLMPSFSSINGVKMHESKALLTGLLKDELGFEGFIITDWAAVTQLSGGSYKAQIANAINAGNDMVMATNGRHQWAEYIRLLKELVEEGIVPIERIDDAVLRILRVKRRLGLFDDPYYSVPEDFGRPENRELARAAAAHSLTLLKNDGDIVGRLPSMGRILVAGAGASDIGMQCGGWTIHWQGRMGDITPGTTLLEGFMEYHDGVTYAPDGKAGGVYDCAIVVIGEEPYAETEGDRPNGPVLRRQDINVLNEVYALGIPVVTVMLSGRPMLVAEEISRWDGLVAAWLPGTEGGGVADVLFGGMEFTGRTPYSWPAAVNSEDVLFPYGYGLTAG